ncbi:alpha/beta-hydrolase [Thozetella sp. PMI_491]|nr:alpha/beta-hydrolase [Thozetella sp. PMI_491]
MVSLPDTGFQGYQSKTLTYKSTKDGDIKLDVVYPEDVRSSLRTVLLHYHGGFLVVGDRSAFLPYWLLKACTSRGWIFVTPDYRLMPESTAQSSVEDAIDAYQWVLSALPQELGCDIGSVLMAGSSAGAYLALTTATTVQKQPSALLLTYGMLDATAACYTTPGRNTFNRPPIETADILAKYPICKPEDTRKAISASPIPADPSTGPRVGLIAALHTDALFLDYMTGIDGLGRSVASEGPNAIPPNHRNLFPIAFGELGKLPPVMLLHGRNDSAVPVTQSEQTAEKLLAAGVDVHLELPEDAEHGFDSRAGVVDVEAAEGEKIPAYQSLRNVISFLHSAAAGKL